MKRLSFLIFINLFALISYAQHDPNSSDELLRLLKADKPEWQYVGSDTKSNKSYIKSKCVSATDQIVKVWTKIVAKSNVIKRKTYINPTLMFLYEYDCANKQSRLI